MKTGLVLTGGGARAAYQVGVLKAVAQIRRECGAPTAQSVPGHRRHLGRRHQRRRAGLPRRRLRRRGGARWPRSGRTSTPSRSTAPIRSA